jgi:ubiquinone/menaquinone biosynthesis C-methylase UbiE
VGSNVLKLEDIVEWDTATWSRALAHGLEIGANRGGLSLYFVAKHGAKMVCSDYVFPEKAKEFHKKHPWSEGNIEYQAIDALNIPYPDDSFDFVCFKSVLGVIGAGNRFDNIEKTVSEIHRVLKPGGSLFFAENLVGTFLHKASRSIFVPWGNRWRYLTLEEVNQLLKPFSQQKLTATGFFTAFCPNKFGLKRLAARLDTGLNAFPSNWKYVSIGTAIK